jgi:hypothetical protein
MFFRRKKTKKLGVFVNYRDFKGNTTDAITKMLNDLKKFGSQTIKNCKVDHLKPGYGEVVCHLVDELLNIELYRREYQFFMPVFPKEAEAEDSPEEEVITAGEGEENRIFSTGASGISDLHGIQINTSTVQSPQPISPTKKRDTL